MNEEQRKLSFSDYLLQFRKKQTEYEPIYRGCLNQQCFCSGKCKEIIGYRHKQTGKIDFNDESIGNSKRIS